MKADLTKLRAAGEVAKSAHQAAAELIRPGTTPEELEEIISSTIKQAGMKPAFLGYKGYPAASCISVNDRVVHGIPDNVPFEEGDVVAVDLGVDNDGQIVDTARTHIVGDGSPQLRKLLVVTENALRLGIEQAQPGKTTGDIGSVIDRTVQAAGFSVIRDLTGHGVGPTLQEPPSIPNFGKPGQGTKLQEGMVLAIEPITALKPSSIAVLDDGWTIITRDGVVTAHFEDTIVVSKDGPIVLT